MKLTADGRRCACPRASVCGSRKAYEATYQAPGEAAGGGGGTGTGGGAGTGAAGNDG